VGSQSFQISEEDLSPQRFFVMKGKSVDGMDDDRHTRQFGGQAAQESSLGIVGMNHVVKIPFEERGEIQESQGILQGM
jgi:hypothetical protein